MQRQKALCGNDGNIKYLLLGAGVTLVIFVILLLVITIGYSLTRGSTLYKTLYCSFCSNQTYCRQHRKAVDRTSNEDEEAAACELINNTNLDKVNTGEVESKPVQTTTKLLKSKKKIKEDVETNLLCKNCDQNN